MGKSKQPKQKQTRPEAGRDARGHFLPGHDPLPGAGRPSREREVEFIGIMRENCTAADWLEITQVAVAAAKRNDGPARKWLSDYLLPKPTQPIEVRRSLVDIITSLCDPDDQPLAD